MAAQNFLHVCIFNNFWRVVLYHRWHVPRRAAPGPKSGGGGAPARRTARVGGGGATILSSAARRDRLRALVQRRLLAVNMTLPAFAAERRATAPLLCAAPAAVNRYFLPTRRSAANLPLAAVAVNRWDRQTNRRTLDRFIDPAPHIWHRVVSLQQLSFL